MQTEVVQPQAVVNQEPLNFKQYALYIFLASIPFIGFILLLVWAFGAEGNIHRKEWAKGMLLIMVIFLGIGIVLSVLGAGMLAGFSNYL